MELPDIIVSGHLCLDLLPQMDHVKPESLMSPGKLFEVGALDISTGGAVSNTGLALHRLGANVALMSGVGDDLIGQVILTFLRQRDPKLIENIRVRAGLQSSYTIVLSPQRIDRVFLHCTGTNATFGIEDIDFTLLEQAKIFHLGYPPILPRLYQDDGAELEEIFRRAKETGIITSLDMSLPDTSSPAGAANWRRILQRVLPYLDIFVPSLEEVIFMLKWDAQGSHHLTRKLLRRLVDELFEMSGHNMVVGGLKLGASGVFLRSGNSGALQHLANRLGGAVIGANAETYHRAFEVNVVGTTGAGDAAYGALLVALCKHMDLDTSACWMCAVGACNVEAADATSGVRTWEETQRRIDAGWAPNSGHVDEE